MTFSLKAHPSAKHDKDNWKYDVKTHTTLLKNKRKQLGLFKLK